MIILIAGDTHTGKTNLAQKLLEHYKIPYVSIDHLKMGLIRSGNTGLTPESDDDTLTEKLWPVVREMIKTCIENNQSLIVEGCYIPWDWKKDIRPIENMIDARLQVRGLYPPKEHFFSTNHPSNENVDVNEMINTDERIHFPFSVQEVANRMIIIVAMTK